MKAIVTKYLPATNTRGSRIKATANGVQSLTIGYHSEEYVDRPHVAAALALARRMGWTGTLVCGGMPDESGEVFCFLDSDKYVI